MLHYPAFRGIKKSGCEEMDGEQIVFRFTVTLAGTGSSRYNGCNNDMETARGSLHEVRDLWNQDMLLANDVRLLTYGLPSLASTKSSC